jgi:hypothetical protein
VTERGAERALFLRRTEKFFKNSQNGAEREAPAKVERGGGLMPVSDMMQSGFQYNVIVS